METTKMSKGGEVELTAYQRTMMRMAVLFAYIKNANP